MLTPPSRRTIAFWRSCLASAFRTSLACAIVACTKFYGPEPLRRLVGLPAFSYVTVILIVDEATLGDAVYGAACALYATIQGVVPAILSLWLIGPTRFSITTSTLAVALSAFLVALPESTHVLCKRIALGQIVLVYEVRFMHGVHKEAAIMHPIHVAVSTGVGAFASVLALLLPYPRLGYYEVNQKSKRYHELVLEKLKFLVNAFCAENSTSAMASVFQAKSLEKTGKNLLRRIKLKQDRIPWERPTTKFAAAGLRTPDRLSNLEMPVKGMEMALASCPSFPVKIANEVLKNHLTGITTNISLTLQQLECPQSSNYSTTPETEKEVQQKLLQPIQLPFPTNHDLPSLFFLFCMRLLHDQSITNDSAKITSQNNVGTIAEIADFQKQEPCMLERILGVWSLRLSSERLMVAFKCSLALGLSVLFGSLFRKDNGFWAGLTVALSMAPWREATFKAANLRTQGTVIGSIYGVLGCFISQNLMELRFLVLVPWIIFTSFLKRSRMYGPAGGVSAAIGAVLLLGIKDFGLPSDFAVVRISEALIGLSCSILVELLLQPTRASTWARIRLCESLMTFQDCVGSMVLNASANKPSTLNNLRKHIDELAKYIEQADVEPNFWFLPFPSTCYKKILSSLSKMEVLLLFGINGIAFLANESHRLGDIWKDIQEHMNGDLELFKKMLCSTMICLEEVTRMKSLARLEMEFEKKQHSCKDLELGRSANANGRGVLSADEEEIEKIVASFLQHAKEDMGGVSRCEYERMNHVFLCLSAIGFCMAGLVKETREIEKSVKELLQWENPSSHINLYEISCKINDMST